MLTVSQINFYFKKVLLKFVLALWMIAVLVSVVDQVTDAYLIDSPSASQVSILQFDKDNNRDPGYALLAFVVAGGGLYLIFNIFYFFSQLYQEPILLSRPRPPNK